MAFIMNYVKDTAAGYMKTGMEYGGTYAGNAVGGVGTMIENSGRGLGEGTVKGGISSVGNMVNGYGAGITNSMAADGPVNRPGKTAVKPAAKKAVTGGQQKALPSSAAKKPATPASKAGTPKKPAGVSKPPARSTTMASGKNTSRPGAPGKPAGTRVPAKSTPAKSVSSAKSPAANTTGKTKISPASRPKGVRP